MTYVDKHRHGFSRKQFVIFIDGPLKGQTIAVPYGVSSYATIDPSDFENVITYCLTQIGFHHGGSKVLLRVASIDIPNWSADDLAEAILTDDAKRARING